MTSTGDPRVVGWYSWGEWDHVRKLLYSLNDEKNQIKGVNMVNVWRSRLRHGALPVSVELTAALVSAYVGNSTCLEGNEYQAQLGSAMAIVRFVNGITDQFQTGIYAQSVQLIADKIKIPDWMVDLRHEATHAQLPALEILKSGLIIALTWLNMHYWKETADKLVEKEQRLTLNLNQHIGDYVDLIFALVEYDESPQKTTKENKRDKQKMNERCYGISRMLQKYIHVGNLRIFINILVQEGFLMLSTPQILLLGITVNNCNHTMDDFSMARMLNFSGLWKPLIQIFQTAFPSFMEQLTTEVVRLTKRNKASETYYSYLLSMFILFTCGNESNKILSKYLLKNPSHLGFQMLQIIIKEGLFADEIKNKVLPFLNIFKPVMHSLNRTSTTFDINKLDTMATEMSVKGKEIIKQLQEASGVDTHITEEITKSWKLISEDDLFHLPPMGDFTSNDMSFLLNTDASCNSILCTNKIITDNAGNFMMDTNHAILNQYSNLKGVIDNLFMDDIVYVGDNDLVNSSCSTDEYQLDVETAWDEEVDFNVDDKNAVKQCCSFNLFNLFQGKNLADCDPSKIEFF